MISCRFCFLIFLFFCLTMTTTGCIQSNVNGVIPPFFAAADYNNNRVLLWRSIPTLSNSPAQIALGQPDTNSSLANNGGVSASSMSLPSGVCSDGTVLFVVDQGNNRVLIWNHIPLVTDQPADFVLGQTSMLVRVNGTGPGGLWQPNTCTVSNGQLFVGDQVSTRVLVWNLPIVRNGQPANLVVGQPTLSGGVAGCTQSTMNRPYAPGTDGQHLAVPDFINNRVLLWNSIPTVNGQNADIVLGQQDFVSSSSNAGGGANPTASTLSAPTHALFAYGKLLVADNYNRRLLIWNSVPTYNQQPADVVVGQPTFTTLGTACSPITAACNAAAFFTFDGRRLYVSDYNSNRVLIYNSIPTVNGQSADLVLGQPDFNSSSANQGGSANALGFKSPDGIFTNGFISGVQTPWGD